MPENAAYRTRLPTGGAYLIPLIDPLLGHDIGRPQDAATAHATTNPEKRRSVYERDHRSKPRSVVPSGNRITYIDLVMVVEESCHRFRAKEVRLRLNMLANNLGNL